MLTDSGVSFSRDIHTEESANIALRLAHGESIPVPTRLVIKGATVTDADLQLIHSDHATIDDFTKDELVICTMHAVHNKEITRPVRFTERALRRFAACHTMGRSILVGHGWAHGGMSIGRSFRATVKEQEVRGVSGLWLDVDAYFPLRNATPDRLQVVTDMLSGVYSYCSIGVIGGDWQYKEIDGPDGADYVYVVDDNPDASARYRLESDELSVVYLGAAPGASVALTERDDDDQEQPISTQTESVTVCLRF